MSAVAIVTVHVGRGNTKRTLLLASSTFPLSMDFIVHRNSLPQYPLDDLGFWLTEKQNQSNFV